MGKIKTLAAALVISLALPAAACSIDVPNPPGDGDGDGDGDTPTPNPGEEEQPPEHLDYFEELATGADQRALTCGRGNADRFAQWYCADPAPTIGKLDDLLIGLGLKNPNNVNQMRFAFTGHSTSLVARRTTSLNPRAVIFTNNADDYLALGFVRGDGLAEIAAFDDSKQRVNFYLIRFDKGCEPDCDNASRFTLANESGWQTVDVYGAPDIQNTPLDCLRCHMPDGENGQRILRMQELQDPWTHFFRGNRGSVTLLDEFQAAHPGEDYAGIPAGRIEDSDPADLEDFVRDGGFDNQPNEFLGDDINEDDPNINTPNGEWMGLYQQALLGQAIAPPYFGISPFDPAKVQSASAAYRAVLEGTADPSTLPDMTDLFLESAERYLGFRAAEGLDDARGIIMHQCATCHSGKFSGEELTRERFVVSDFPDNLDAEMKALVLKRIKLGPTYRTRMPPLMAGELEASEVAIVEAALTGQ